MALTGGQTFAGYRIVRLLSSGGMGEVYLVEHPRLPRRNALKVLPADVKPANIMLTDASDEGDERRILLSDFGIARNIDDVSGLTATNFTVGTVAYSSPEQLTGGTIDGRADQYALAATAYELLTGSLLFPDSNPAVVIGRHLTASPPQLRRRRPELAALDPVLSRALSKKPTERFVRCADFARALTDSTQTASREAASATTTAAPAANAPADKQETVAAQHQPAPPPRLTSAGGSTSTMRVPRVPRWVMGVAATIGVVITVAGLVSVFGDKSPPTPGSSDTSTPQTPATAAQAPLPATPPSSAPPARVPIKGSIAGMIVMLDPGLNGANDDSINRQVPSGRGGTANCEVPGNVTDDGYPEHTFNWDVTLRVHAELNALGLRTAMTPGNDTALGPCVDERARMGNALHPNAIVSIRASIGLPDEQGFYVQYSDPPLDAAQAGPSVQFARTVRDQMQASGFVPDSSVSQDGLRGKGNVVELNLAQYPAVQIVCGNVKNADEAASMETSNGRQKYSEAIARGVAAFLGGQAH